MLTQGFPSLARFARSHPFRMIVFLASKSPKTLIMMLDMTEDNLLPCADKMVFNTKKEADATALAADWQHGASLKSYKCRYCQLWHLSSS